MADRYVEDIRLHAKKRVSFSTWKKHEAMALSQLSDRRHSVADALEAAMLRCGTSAPGRSGPRTRSVEAQRFTLTEANAQASNVQASNAKDGIAFPELRSRTWLEVYESCFEEPEGTQFDVAMAWFGDAIAACCPALHRGTDLPRKRGNIVARAPRERPWRLSFEATANQGPEDSRHPEMLYRDWLTDHLWSLDWTDAHSFETMCADVMTRYLMAKHMANRMLRIDQRMAKAAPDPAAAHIQGPKDGPLHPPTRETLQRIAAAESIFVVDLVASAEFWQDVVQAMR